MRNESFTDGCQGFTNGAPRTISGEWICIGENEERIVKTSALGDSRDVTNAEGSEMQDQMQPQTINEWSNAATAHDCAAHCLNGRWGETTEFRSSGSNGDPPGFLSSLHETFSASAALPSFHPTYARLGFLPRPHWSEPAQHSIEDIEILECWGIGAACRASNASDLDVEVCTDEEVEVFVSAESDDEAMADQATMTDLNDSWLHRRQRLSPRTLLSSKQTKHEFDGIHCTPEVLEKNAELSNWWFVMSSYEEDEQEERKVARECSLMAFPDSFDYWCIKDQMEPQRLKHIHDWKQHAAVLKYFEWIQQLPNAGTGECWDIEMASQGEQVPSYFQTKSGSCRWSEKKTFKWYWKAMVCQLDDEIIRDDGLTDMQYVFQGLALEACTVSKEFGGFFIHRTDGTSVRLVPNFRKNEIFASQYWGNIESLISRRMMQFNLNDH